MAISSLINVNPQDAATIDLGRVLSRLERKILSSDADPRLQHSSYERTKTSGNLEYARTLLLRLEHSSSSIKLPSRKQAVQSDLFTQRALTKRLTDRLHDLEAHGDDDYLLQGPSDEEDILGEDKPPAPAEPPRPENPTLPTSSAIQESSPSTLRNRHHHPHSSTTLHPTGVSPSNSTNPANTTDLLAHTDNESANLTASLFQLAQTLKANTTAFSASLDADNEALNRATEGLDRNTTGMEAAGKRMGLLKKMSEGKGWWGRMMLYAWIGGLWVVALALVFVGPKLRF